MCDNPRQMSHAVAVKSDIMNARNSLNHLINQCQLGAMSGSGVIGFVQWARHD